MHSARRCVLRWACTPQRRRSRLPKGAHLPRRLRLRPSSRAPMPRRHHSPPSPCMVRSTPRRAMGVCLNGTSAWRPVGSPWHHQLTGHWELPQPNLAAPPAPPSAFPALPRPPRARRPPPCVHTRLLSSLTLRPPRCTPLPWLCHPSFPLSRRVPVFLRLLLHRRSHCHWLAFYHRASLPQCPCLLLCTLRL